MTGTTEKGPASKPVPKKTTTERSMTLSDAAVKDSRASGATLGITTANPGIVGNPTTTRTCAGDYCWCRCGRELPPTTTDTNAAPASFYWDHREYMDGLAVRIRRLEIEQGPVL